MLNLAIKTIDHKTGDVYMVATVQKKKLTEGRKTWVVLIAIYLSIAPALATN